MSLMGLVTLIWRGDMWVKIARDASGSALDTSAQRVLDESQLRVPYNTGALSDSGHIERNGTDTADVVYDTSYAIIVHAHPEWGFQSGREAHWLEDSLSAAGNGFEEGLRSAWPA